MNYYETLYIIHPALESGRLKDTILNVQKQIEKNKANQTLCTEVWGKKRLAYLIEKQKYGTYILVQYSGDGKEINELNIEMEQNPNILAYMTVKIIEPEIREQMEDVESQILGNEKESRLDKFDDRKDTTKPSPNKQNRPTTKNKDAKPSNEESLSEGLKILEIPASPVEDVEVKDKDEMKE